MRDEIMEFNSNSKKYWLVIALLFHTFIALFLTAVIITDGVLFDNYGGWLKKFYPYLLGVSAVLGVIALIVVIEIVRLLEIEAKSFMQQEKMRNMEEFNLALREQRHDFLNHLQVISGFIQINKTDQAKAYLLGLSDSLLAGDGKGIFLDSEVGMLLYSKKIKADRYQIIWNHNLELNMDILAIPRLELVRILGNLLDNALYELQQVPVEKRRLNLEIIRQQELAVINLTNYGTAIDDHIVKYAFDPGFTTKKTAGDGMGLYIVKSLVEKWGGQVSITGDKEGPRTTVTITCPLLLNKGTYPLGAQDDKKNNYA
jgi:sensor histidine kinase regulating citrate/malate metabolism